jgi:glycerol uptake facilitator-like aquaporin
MVYGLFKWSRIWAYWLAQFVGAGVAAFVFLYVQQGEKPERDLEAARSGRAARGA